MKYRMAPPPKSTRTIVKMRSESELMGIVSVNPTVETVMTVM